MFKFRHIALAGFIFFVCAQPAAAASSSGLVNGVWFSQDPVTDFREVTVYSVLHNQTDELIQGIATLVVDGEAVKASEVSIGKGDIKKVGISYLFKTGGHNVSMSFTAGNVTEVTHTQLSAHNIFVVKDTDGDGIRNTTDSDDDNDGILDVDDVEPLVKNILPKKTIDLTESGKTLFNKIVTRNDNEGKAVEENTKEASTSTLATTLAAIEESRKKAASALAAYEEEQRNALVEIARKEQTLPEFEGFEGEVDTKEASKKREHQIAAASASIAGTMISKAWMFYAEMVVLTLGALHLIWVAIRRKFFSIGVEEEE